MALACITLTQSFNPKDSLCRGIHSDLRRITPLLLDGNLVVDAHVVTQRLSRRHPNIVDVDSKGDSNEAQQKGRHGHPV